MFFASVEVFVSILRILPLHKCVDIRHNELDVHCLLIVDSLSYRSSAPVPKDIRLSHRYELVIRVQTGGKISRLAQVRVIVTVTDINDNAPLFKKDEYYATATVSTAPRTVITTVRS